MKQHTSEALLAPMSQHCQQDKLSKLGQQTSYTPRAGRILFIMSFGLVVSNTGYARIVAGEMDVQNVKLEVIVKNGALINLAYGGDAAMNIASNIGVSVKDVRQSVYIDGNVVNKADKVGRKSTVNIGVISCEGEYR
jgi:hypothetical protein